MTHNLELVIKFKTYEQTREFYNAIFSDEEFSDLYCLRKNDNYMIDSMSGSQPVFYFPEKAEGDFSVNIETGSHVGFEDKLEALHWFYFCQALLERFEEFELLEVPFYFCRSGENKKYKASDMLKRIISGTE
jgi:hypothetical protein